MQVDLGLIRQTEVATLNTRQPMTTERPTPPIRATVQPNTIRLFVALELSRSKWLVTVSAPGSDKLSKYVVAGGDGDALLDLVARLRAEAERRAGQPVHVLVIQEAGLDGFRIHRLLEQNGIESQVADPASIAVDRRHRRAKTDAIAGEMLLRTLMAWRRGERRVCSMVKPPSPEEEDRRRLTRERGTLTRERGTLTRERGTLLKERTQHTKRIKGLLAGQGITDYDPLRQDRPALRSPAPGSSGPSRGAQDRRRAALARAAQSGDPSRDRADRPGLRPDRRSRA
jgi:transposase